MNALAGILAAKLMRAPLWVRLVFIALVSLMLASFL